MFEARACYFAGMALISPSKIGLYSPSRCTENGGQATTGAATEFVKVLLDQRRLCENKVSHPLLMGLARGGEIHG